MRGPWPRKRCGRLEFGNSGRETRAGLGNNTLDDLGVLKNQLTYRGNQLTGPPVWKSGRLKAGFVESGEQSDGLKWILGNF
jgi:hypothetical protein